MSIFSDPELLRSALLELIDYDFATNDQGESDNAENSLSGEPTIQLSYEAAPAAAPFLSRRVETQQKATAIISTEGISSQNYTLGIRNITVLEAIAEEEGVPQIFCQKNSNYAEMGANTCLAINGEIFVSLFCVIDDTCLPINAAALPLASCA
ncbi:MAG: hypothetical protein LBC85_00085 [Fibromonadaceae bacterium]|jgi:hypothetical protein|nr:hypothetical protein [Fibromonadaceae bacterium]